LQSNLSTHYVYRTDDIIHASKTTATARTNYHALQQLGTRHTDEEIYDLLLCAQNAELCS